MVYSIPLIGWAIGFFFHIMLAIPFYFLWNALAPTYAYWLPEVYQQLGFWRIVGLFATISILKFVLLPRFASLPSDPRKK